MQQSLNSQRALFLVLGVAIGVGVAGWLPNTPLHAVATHGQDNFALATGRLDEEVEAVYFLDFLTGDLKAAVLNPQTHKFSAFYKTNILQHMTTNDVKNPRFLIVTGQAKLRRGTGATQVGESVVYVCEVNSGKMIAYGIPWVPERQALGANTKTALVPLDGVEFRNVQLREK